ncbi:MAG: hypothetical protein ACXWTY_16815 [Methylobacter sp.]
MKCDCLNYCGDDPWLKDRRAEPCDEKKIRDAVLAEKCRKREILKDKPYYSAICDQPGHILVKMPGMEYGISNSDEARQLAQTLVHAVNQAWPDLS